MKRILIFLFLIKCSFSFAQNIDLTSVDEFLKVSDLLKMKKEVNVEQWHQLDSSTAYSIFAHSKDNTIINIVKTTMQDVFGYSDNKGQINNDGWLETLIKANFEEIKRNYSEIKKFRDSYDFKSLILNAKSRLQTFLRCDSLNTSVKWKPVYFLFLNADGKDMEEALVIDFNLIYRMTEEQRINFLAHEFFHVYRAHFENHDFNYANDINFMLDMIANEGIADQIDKYMGYEEYYSTVSRSQKLAEEFVSLYSNAPKDIAILQTIIVQYAEQKIDKDTCVDKLLKIYKYNGHALGFYMSQQIINAGLKKEMLESFYNPYEFYRLYHMATNKNNGSPSSKEFMNYLKRITEQYY